MLKLYILNKKVWVNCVSVWCVQSSNLPFFFLTSTILWFCWVSLFRTSSTSHVKIEKTGITIVSLFTLLPFEAPRLNENWNLHELDLKLFKVCHTMIIMQVRSKLSYLLKSCNYEHVTPLHVIPLALFVNIQFSRRCCLSNARCIRPHKVSLGQQQPFPFPP